MFRAFGRLVLLVNTEDTQMLQDRDVVPHDTQPASDFAMWYANNEPDEMTKRLYLWRMENQALCMAAQTCEDKTTGRLVVERSVVEAVTEASVDRRRIFNYVKRRRAIVPRSFSERFVSLPYLPTYFDRAYRHQQNFAVDYYGDVRELTQDPVVANSAVRNAGVETIAPVPRAPARDLEPPASERFGRTRRLMEREAQYTSICAHVLRGAPQRRIVR